MSDDRDVTCSVGSFHLRPRGTEERKTCFGRNPPVGPNLGGTHGWVTRRAGQGVVGAPS